MKSFLKIILCCLMLVWGGFALFQTGFRINLTPSVPRGIYILVPGSPWRGDMVSLCLEDPFFVSLAKDRGYLRSGSCPCGLEPLLKTLVGLPGDRLEITPEGLCINGDLQPNSRLVVADSHGRPMSVSMALAPGTIPPGMGLVLSDGHPGGFDGRYFGFTPLASLQRAQPVLTFN